MVLFLVFNGIMGNYVQLLDNLKKKNFSEIAHQKSPIFGLEGSHLT